MAKKDAEFEILFNKYNLAVAKSQDLQEQLSTKQEQWSERNKLFDVIEQNVRELCESILAKDNKEMVLGEEYSWSNTPLIELINRSKKVFKEYNAQRTIVMRKLMDTAEERRDQIESLKEQIIQMKTRGVEHSEKLSREEIEEQIEKEEQRKKEQKDAVAASKTLNPEVQEAVEQGDIHLVQIKDDMMNGKAVVVGEDEDFLDDVFDSETRTAKPSKEKKILKDVIKKTASAKLTSTSMTVVDSQKERNYKNEQKNQVNKQYTMKLLNEFEEKISEVGWILMEVIGKYGYSTTKDIVNKGLELSGNNPKITAPRLTSNLSDLEKNHILRKEKIPTPFAQMTVYTFTEEGVMIYKGKFGKSPVISEADRLIAEHDNLIHGYSIRDCARAIEAAGFFKKAEIWNRKNAISLEGGVQYIPDIVCHGENGEKLYLEYERDHYQQKSFNIKLNKMLYVTPVINFVGANRAICESLMEKMVKWAATKGKGDNMKNVVLRVTMAKSLNVDLRNDDNWAYTFRPLKDKEYVNHF